MFMAAKRRERWYSIEGQRRSHRHALEATRGSRQLISLVLLLALILIAMRQVSDPQKVGRVATAIGLLPDPKAARLAPEDAPEQGSGTASELPHASQDAPEPQDAEGLPDAATLESVSLRSEAETVAIQADALAQLFLQAPSAVMSELVGQWLHLRETAGPIPGEAPTDSEELRAWASGAQQTLARWIDASDSIAGDHVALISLQRMFLAMTSDDANKEKEVEVTVAEETRRAMHLALDRHLLRAFADNTPWRTSDRIPLVRTTQRAMRLHQGFREGWLFPEMIPSVSVPQLMTQTDSYRGHAVRVTGTVVKVDSSATMRLRSSDEMRYDVVWLKPGDASGQPIIVHVPEELQDSGVLLTPDRNVSVVGLLAKRRAYASQRGGDVAPVLVAASIQAASEPGAPTPALSSLQRAVAQRWHAAESASPWSPPADTLGALQRVHQRLASRLALLEPLSQSATPDDREAILRLGNNESVLAALLGLSKVAEEVDLLTRAEGMLVPDSQVRLVRLSGTVTQTFRIPIETSPFPGLDWREVFACIVEQQPIGNAPPITWIALAPTAPMDWVRAPELRQPAIAKGIALPLGDEAATSQIILCSDVQWRNLAQPAQSAPDLGSALLTYAPTLPAGWHSLLDRGWNLGWLDLLESLQGQPMSARESEAFYSLLAAARAPKEAQVASEKPLEVMQLIRRAEGQKRAKGTSDEKNRSSGHRAAGTVHVRRVQRIEVNDLAERTWLGSDHYYQLDGFADIGRNRIEIQYGEGIEPVVFEREFPITLVAIEVPDWLLVESGDADPGASRSWYPRVRVDAQGWFYRMWRFKTTQVSLATDDKQAQQGPLMAVDRWQLAGPATPTQASTASPAWVAAVTSVIGILGLLLIAWQIRTGFKKRNTRRK